MVPRAFAPRRGARSQDPWVHTCATTGVTIATKVALTGPASTLFADARLAPAGPRRVARRAAGAHRGRARAAARSSSCATGTARQRIVDLDGLGSRVSVGRAPSNEISLPWDTEVSRLHAELECIGGEWTVSDDGLSRNGTYVNGGRISGRHRLRDGDVLRVGRTAIAFRRPADGGLHADARRLRDAAASPSSAPTQRQVLVALARPYKHDEFASPATNQDDRRRAAPQRRRGEVAPARALPALRDRAPAPEPEALAARRRGAAVGGHLHPRPVAARRRVGPP